LTKTFFTLAVYDGHSLNFLLWYSVLTISSFITIVLKWLYSLKQQT